jgi:LacI family transcriptional regulator
MGLRRAQSASVPAARRRRVALLIESSRAYGRGLLRGIAAYAHTHGPWSLFHQERRLGDDAPHWFRRWKGDGVIARIESPRLLTMMRRAHRPCVDVRGLYLARGIPAVDTDDAAVARLAVTHLIERGFQRLAYCGFAGLDYSIRRRDAFIAHVRSLGHEPLVYEGDGRPRAGDTTAIEAEQLLYEDHIAHWLAGLPKPVGVMACNDIRAVQVLSACRDHGIPCPDDVAVIGVDNDELLCQLSDPPLS